MNSNYLLRDKSLVLACIENRTDIATLFDYWRRVIDHHSSPSCWLGSIDQRDYTNCKAEI